MSTADRIKFRLAAEGIDLPGSAVDQMLANIDAGLPALLRGPVAALDKIRRIVREEREAD